MAGILRESCLEIIDKTYEAINSSLDGKNVDSNIWLKDLSARMERINRLRKKKDYLETIKCLDRDGLQEYFNLVGRMARELRLPIYRCFVDMEIAEEQELLTLYANGVVHERGKSIEIDQGMRIRFRLESKNQDAKQRVEVEWDKKRKGKGEQEGFYEALNDIKNMVDTDSLDREFAFEQVGEYKVSSAVYKYMKKSLIKKIKTLAQAYECTVIVNEGEELYEGMEFKDKLWEALSAVDWKGVVQDSMFDVTSQLPIMVGTIVLLSGVLIAISMSPIGWLAPMVGTAMQVFGLSGAVEDVARGIYMFTDAILRIRDAKSKAGMSQATRHLEESFRQVAPSLMLDVLLFLGGKRVAGNPSDSDLVREVPRARAKSKPQALSRRTPEAGVSVGSGDGMETNLLDNMGKFSDDVLENNYQVYVNRKISRGQLPKERLEWKQVSEYWTKESPIARGNNFNKRVREADIYDYHEVYLENGKRLDSYDSDAEEIISRKATNLDKIIEETYRGYLSEFSQKYSEGTRIRSNAYPELDGQELKGQYILEVPASNADISNIDYYKQIAAEYNVILRFTEEME